MMLMAGLPEDAGGPVGWIRSGGYLWIALIASVLAGMCASLLAQGKAPFDCACAAVYLHGLAGDLAAERLGKISMLPSDIIDELPNAFRACGF